jgi:hypothetical protein
MDRGGAFGISAALRAQVGLPKKRLGRQIRDYGLNSFSSRFRLEIERTHNTCCIPAGEVDPLMDTDTFVVTWREGIAVHSLGITLRLRIEPLSVLIFFVYPHRTRL